MTAPSSRASAASSPRAAGQPSVNSASSLPTLAQCEKEGYGDTLAACEGDSYAGLSTAQHVDLYTRRLMGATELGNARFRSRQQVSTNAAGSIDF